MGVGTNQPTGPPHGRAALDAAPVMASSDGDGAAAGPAPPLPLTPGEPGVLDIGPGPHDLERPEFFLNRELTQLNFYLRVLQEAEDSRNPLLERVRFASIVSNNIDEFVMKRLGGLKQQVGARVQELTVDGRTPERQIAECYEVIRALQARLRTVMEVLGRLLQEEGVEILGIRDLSRSEVKDLRGYYHKNIHPLVTPQASDPAHPFPFISNLSLNLLVTLREPGDEDISLARVKVPVGVDTPRFVRIGDSNRFVPLEKVILLNLDVLFPGMEVVSADVFRVTRNANTEIEEESADDLLEMIEIELRERRFAPVVRLEVAADADPSHVSMLQAEMGLEDSDVFQSAGLLGLRDLSEIAALDLPHLHYPVHHPFEHPALKPDRDVFQIIRDSGPILLRHPYQSFTASVERFLREASVDPDVRAIKMTLYRTSEETNAVRYLIDAARHGKQVAVVVELKASFDEAANIRWANRLEAFGIHVTYGVVGLKTHCKATLVVRQEAEGIVRYAHVGTGNYHAGTARQYSDLGLLTADSKLGQDLTELFNYLTTGFKPKRKYKRLLPAPKILKRTLLDLVDQEIRHHERGAPAHIQFKMNALEDPDVVRALYRATMAGVPVDLLVRDTCRLRPGIQGLSESARVLSIVGRFLEHARIYYFAGGGDPEYYIGSADCMTRNLHNRVEIVVPVEGEPERAELRGFLDAQLADRRGGWEMRSDGSYERRSHGDDAEAFSSQLEQLELAESALREALRLKKRRPRQLARRNVR